LLEKEIYHFPHRIDANNNEQPLVMALKFDVYNLNYKEQIKLIFKDRNLHFKTSQRGQRVGRKGDMLVH